MPAYCSVYFAVAEADAAASRSVELGGSVVQEPEDSPCGRLAELAEPTGTRFKVVAGG